MKIYDYDGAKNLCGDRIRQARVVKRLTQGDLTAKMQLTGVRIEREAISKIESGSASWPTMSWSTSPGSWA